MSKSSSQKKLAHRLRQGKLDPKMQRGSWGLIKPITKSLPNKKKDAKNKEKD